jgi:phage shock protein PspC (stress-responsive transcriptional regulator)
MAGPHAAAKDCDMNEQSTSDTQTGMDRLFDALRGIGIRRRTDDKWIAGVCSGLADRMGIDPVIIRAGFVLVALLGGVGITIYLVAWVLIPNDSDEIVAQRALRDGHSGSVVLLVFAALALFGGSWWSHDSGWVFPWLLVPLGLLTWWLAHRHDDPYAGQRARTQQLSTAGTAPSPMTSGLLPAAGGPVAPKTQTIPRTAVATRRLRRRSGGLLMTLIAIGLALAAYGSLTWAANAFSWTGNHAAIAFAGSLAAIGLLLVVIGLVGWRAGFVTLVAVILALSAWANTVIPTGIQVSGRVGDAAWTPNSITAATSYHLGVGDGVLDLGKLAGQSVVTAAAPPTIAASVGLGDLKVLVPPGLNVRVVGHVGLGEILLPGDVGNSGQGGSGVSRSIVMGEGPTEVVVNAGVGIGQLTVVKE